MGFRFKKSFKVAPGVRLNVGKKSASVSFGGKGFRTSVSTSGRRTNTVGIPGTGISHVSTSGGKRSKAKHHRASSHQKPASPLLLKICGIIMMIVAAFALLMTIAGFSVDVFTGIILLIPTAICFFIGRFFLSVSKQ